MGERKVKTGTAVQRNRDGEVHNEVYGEYKKPPAPDATYGGEDGTETIAAFECAEGCPVAELDRQSGVSKSTGGVQGGTIGKHGIYNGFEPKVRANAGGLGDEGGASRFFNTFEPDAIDDAVPFIYAAKASRAERGKDNKHPTVKSVKLMRHLVRLVTSPGGTVLDPFTGSGSTGVAALREGFHFIGVEREEEYLTTARARLQAEQPSEEPKTSPDGVERRGMRGTP